MHRSDTGPSGPDAVDQVLDKLGLRKPSRVTRIAPWVYLALAFASLLSGFGEATTYASLILCGIAELRLDARRRELALVRYLLAKDMRVRFVPEHPTSPVNTRSPFGV